jgi:hypothetical protein
MSLDAEHMRITDHGTVTVGPGSIVVDYFEAEGASCRDVAVLACAWAIGELQREMLKDLQEPGGGYVAIGMPKGYTPVHPQTEYVLDLLVAAGHISREKAFQVRDIATEFGPGAPSEASQIGDTLASSRIAGQEKKE